MNTQDEQEIAAQFNIRSIPTLMIFRDQVVLYAEAGALPQSAFEKLVEDAKAVDMAEVQKAIEEEENKAQQQPSA